MAREVIIESFKTYKNVANCERSVKALNLPDDLRYMIVWDKAGRCYPVFLGTECLRHMVHFHFPVVG